MSSKATLIRGLVRDETKPTALSLFITHNTSTARGELEHTRLSSRYLPDDLSKLKSRDR